MECCKIQEPSDATSSWGVFKRRQKRWRYRSSGLQMTNGALALIINLLSKCKNESPNIWIGRLQSKVLNRVSCFSAWLACVRKNRPSPVCSPTHVSAFQQLFLIFIGSQGEQGAAVTSIGFSSFNLELLARKGRFKYLHTFRSHLQRGGVISVPPPTVSVSSECEGVTDHERGGGREFVREG